MLPFKLVWHHGYDLNLGEHVFPAQKYRLIRERMLSEGFAREADFIQPEAAGDEDMLLVHTEDWITRLRAGRLRFEEILRLEIPYSEAMVRGFWLATGGTILAARLALRDRLGFNIGGGFHHAYAGHGEGFCAVNDVAVALRRLQHDGAIGRAMVVDCDVHHGNGTAAIFAADPSVLTLSIHQWNNYPEDKPDSTVDIHLNDFVGDDEYLARLRGALLAALDDFRPALVMFVAGADPYKEDQLGGLSLTLDGLAARDRLVIGSALDRSIPVAIVLAGGYAANVEDTVAIHCQTARSAAGLLGWQPEVTDPPFGAG
ncbi:MAG: histone deacetylase [Acidobacteria bacterium]|nr:histone deacetylase [Acidobacteriota bacterium]